MLPGELYGKLTQNAKRGWNAFTDTDRTTFIDAMSGKSMSANTHQLDTLLEDSYEPYEHTDSDIDMPTGELSVNQAAKHVRPGSKPPAKGPVSFKPNVNDTHPADPRRMLSQPPKTRPNALRPAPPGEPVRKANMARFSTAIDDYWGDQPDGDDCFYDAMPDFR